MGEVHSFYFSNNHVLGENWAVDFVSTQFTVKVFTGGDIILNNDANLLRLLNQGLSSANSSRRTESRGPRHSADTVAASHLKLNRS